jgi:hypothetical protein
VAAAIRLWGKVSQPYSPLTIFMIIPYHGKIIIKKITVILLLALALPPLPPHTQSANTVVVAASLDSLLVSFKNRLYPFHPPKPSVIIAI